MSKKRYVWILATAAGLVGAQNVFAPPLPPPGPCDPGDVNSWNGTNSDLWDRALNWDLGTPPDADDDVIFAINSTSIMNLGFTNNFGREILSMDVSQIGDLKLGAAFTGDSSDNTRLYSLCDFKHSTAANAYTVRLGPHDWLYIGDPKGTPSDATTTGFEWEILGKSWVTEAGVSKDPAFFEMAGTFGCGRVTATDASIGVGWTITPTGDGELDARIPGADGVIDRTIGAACYGIPREDSTWTLTLGYRVL